MSSSENRIHPTDEKDPAMSAIAAYGHRAHTQTQEKFEKLVEEVRKKALSFAISLTRNRADADDLLQLAIVKAWTHFDAYQDDKPFQNWLLKIIMRSHLDAVRTVSRRPKMHSLDSLVSLEDGMGHAYEPMDPTPLPDDPFTQNQLQAKVERALAELPESHRRIIRMCDADGLSYSEIAEAEGLTIPTVRSRLHRARKIVRRALKGLA
jgi:RNA polymerase sigma-70 factor (ECF subfamily)